MQEKHVNNPQPGITFPLTEERFAEACRASAQAYRDMRNRIRMRFREIQQETYMFWAAWDEAS